MYSAIVAALKAIPALVDAVKELGQLYSRLQDEATERRFNKLRGQVNETIKRIEHAENNEERKALARRLSDLMSE